MSSFRNIIARRRPSGGLAAPESDGARTPPSDSALVESLLQDISPGGRSSLVDQSKVEPEVPKWELEAPRPTMGSELLKLRPAEPAQAPETADAAAAPAPAQTPEAIVPAPAAPERAAPTLSRPRIWDIDPETPAAPPPQAVSAPEDAVMAPKAPPPLVMEEPVVPAVPALAPARGGRVKTRLLGFHTDAAEPDVFAAEKVTPAGRSITCPIGWLVIVDGPGRGQAFTLAQGLSTIGRGTDQSIPLDFGDDAISRDNHAAIAYDEEENTILIGHGGKSNLVRLNGKPLVSTTELATGDLIRVGKTTLRFTALCGPDFSWAESAGEGGTDG
ncbi:FHA domain-containing protein [Tropicibacter sp. S64]|uniref:FHA domain-containing protein n=1 Tax=Tropicibacter sp. S64 TaxID=3415122 RepID=UPI003C7DA924